MTLLLLYRKIRIFKFELKISKNIFLQNLQSKLIDCKFLQSHLFPINTLKKLSYALIEEVYIKTNRIFISVFLVFISTPLFSISETSNDSQFFDFLKSLESELPISIDYLKLIGEKIFLAGPSFAERHGLINQTAIGSYNSILNTLVINEVLLTRSENHLVIASIPEIKKRLGIIYSTSISIILHELAHAEYDRFLFKSQDPIDRKLKHYMQNEIPEWLERAHPELNYFERVIALSELFGYFHEAIYNSFYESIQKIYENNGYNQIERRCYSNELLIKKIKNLTFPEFTKFSTINLNQTESFRSSIREKTIFVLGVDISLFNTKIGDFPNEYFELLWDQFAAHFNPPKNEIELVDFLNNHSQEFSFFKKCREDLWQKIHPGAQNL
jgi:hypothetical protein